MMKFLLAKHEKTVATFYPIDTDPETRTQISMVYSVTGDMAGNHVHTDLVGYRKRRRSFRIDRLEIQWVHLDGRFTTRGVTATGKTVLSDGTISELSNGYRYWGRDERMPYEIAHLVADADKRTADEVGA